MIKFDIVPTNKEEALKIINERHALVDLKPDDVSIFKMTLSDQVKDSHETRMTAQTIKNYAADFNEGRPFLAVHNKKDLAVGRIFYGKTSGTELSRANKNVREAGLSLEALFYIQNGLNVGNYETDDLVRGIEGGTHKSVSIGFDLDLENDVICSVCDKPASTCKHKLGRSYDGQKMFFWLDNGRAIEGSLVSTGSNPNAKITEFIREREGNESMLVEDVVKRLAGVNPDYGKRIKPEADDNQLIETLLDIVDENNRVLKDKETEISNLTSKAKIADDYLNDLVEQAVQSKVRALGTGKFDDEKYRTTLVRIADVDSIRAEIETFNEIAKTKLDSERQVKPDEKEAKIFNTGSYR